MALTKIKTSGIADNAITNAKMADDAIDSADFANASIDNVHVATGLDAVKLADGTVTNAEFQYINTLSSNAQTQISAALPKSGGAMTGAITTNSTFDGVDIATRDGILSSTTTTAGAALPKAGGTMTGSITMASGQGDFHVQSTSNIGWGSGTERLYGHTGSNYIRIDTNSIERLRITSAGVFQFKAVDGGAESTTLSTNAAGHTLFGNDTANRDMNYNVTGTGSHYFGTAAGNMVIFNNSGNVGIGTTAPQGNLDITVPFAKTDTSSRTFCQFGKSNDSTSYSSIQMTMVGGVSAADRYWAFQTIEQTVANAGNIVFQQSGGNVGIGISAALQKLHVEGNVRLGDGYSVGWGGVQSQIKGSNASDNLEFQTNATTRLTIANGGNVSIGGGVSNNKLCINGNITHQGSLLSVRDGNYTIDVDQAGGYSSEYFRVTFNGSAQERFRITQAGNVGIGTATPANLLHISQASANTVMRIGNNGNYDQYIYFNGGNDWVLGMDYSDSNKFKISGHSSFAGTDDFLTIDTAGNVGIGTASPEDKLHVAGNALITSSLWIGAKADENAFYTSSSGSSSTAMYIGNEQITTSSDKRLKKNIIDTESNGLSVVNKFRVVDFNWDDPSDQCINNKNARGTWTGFLAQEALEVAPYSVNAPRPEGKEIDYDSESTWKMNYGQLVPILTKAIQELSAKVEALENA